MSIRKSIHILDYSPSPSPLIQHTVMAHPIARCQATLGSIMRSPSFGASMKKLEIAFRLSFRFMITPIFVGVAVVMMSSVAYYWLALVQPAWEHPAGSWTWCLNTGMGVWLLLVLLVRVGGWNTSS